MYIVCVFVNAPYTELFYRLYLVLLCYYFLYFISFIMVWTISLMQIYD